MKKYYRATITLPTEVYRRTKVKAAVQNKSFSRFVAELLHGRAAGRSARQRRAIPFGKYHLKGKAGLSRRAIYETYLRRKVSR